MKYTFLTLLLLPSIFYAAEAEDESKTVKIGNFSLPPSQQPAPLIGIGEKVLEKGLVQWQLLLDSYFSKDRYIIEEYGSILYGITDRLSILFEVPVALESRYGPYEKWGIEDVYVQMEYAFYVNTKRYYTEQASIVGTVFFPVGDPQFPILGYETPSLFLGGAYINTQVDWFFFAASGVFMNEPHNRLKNGNIYYYQFGFGKNFYTLPKWLFAWMIEIDGEYTEKDVFQGFTIPDSGGNVVFVTPSLWISSEHFILQAGFGYAALQKQNGFQLPQRFLTALQISWTL